jgi:hypothetical protein
MKHKHAELIKAWADGAEIQIRASSGGNWSDDSSPYWDGNNLEYRIKPESQTDLIVLLREEITLMQKYLAEQKMVGHFVNWRMKNDI